MVAWRSDFINGYIVEIDMIFDVYIHVDSLLRPVYVYVRVYLSLHVHMENDMHHKFWLSFKGLIVLFSWIVGMLAQT